MRSDGSLAGEPMLGHRVAVWILEAPVVGARILEALSEIRMPHGASPGLLEPLEVSLAPRA